jgi:ubiquinone/menaquinone biosynthesis C-methylase UbiE
MSDKKQSLKSNARKSYVFKKCISTNFLRRKLSQILENDLAYKTVLDKARILDDDAIFALIEKYYQKIDNSTFNTHKIKYLKNVPGLNSDSSVLDFGGANGLIADAIAKEYKMPVVNITDIHEQSFLVDSRLIKYSRNIDEKLPYADNQFYLITAFMVLHHIEPQALNRIINELYRCCNRYLLIQEHDCDRDMKYILDILHGMYMYVFKTDDYGKMDSFAQYKAWYKSAAQFDKILSGKFVLLNRFHTNKVQNNFVALYEKIKN